MTDQQKTDLDHAELGRLAEAATPGPWTNIDALRGEKKSVWVADTAREETERDGVTPSRYGPSRTTICNALASNYSLPGGGYKTLDPYPNAAFIAAFNPSVAKALLSDNAALTASRDAYREQVATMDLMMAAEKKRADEAEESNSRWLLRYADIREAAGIGHKPMLSEVPDAIRALRAERDEAVNVVRPFAAAADDLDDDMGDLANIWEAPAAMNIDAGHLRAALAFLQSIARETGK